MNRPSRGIPLALLLVATACKPSAPRLSSPADSAAMASAHASVPAMDPEVRLAASITKAMQSHPQFAESILVAYHTTRPGLDSMVARIQADSTRNATYQRLVGPTPLH